MYTREQIEQALRGTFTIVEQTVLMPGGEQLHVKYASEEDKEWQDKLVRDFFENLDELLNKTLR